MNTIDCMQRAIDFIEDNLSTDISPEVIASQAYISTFHFQRMFTVLCGMSLGEYIRARRLTMAGIELTKDSYRIIDVAIRWGYESHESFTRAFTRHHGLSPSAARKYPERLRPFHPINLHNDFGGKKMEHNLKRRGYTVRENAPVYYTTDMDRTSRWFEETLGWYAHIDHRDEKGHGVYGCIMSIPHELSSMTLMPFNGFHMFRGEAEQRVVAFMRVDDVEKLHAFVITSGWTQISPITRQPWGGMECSVTTIDGSVMRFFQLN